MQTWLSTLSAHVQRVYSDDRGRATLRLPAIRRLAAQFGWHDMELFDQMQQGFDLLGDVTNGLGWRIRDDSKYASPTNVNDFIRENNRITVERLTRQKVTAEEVAKDVKRGRMTGPYKAPPHWPKRTVALAAYELPPNEPTPCAFALPVIQTGSDGKLKVRRAEDWRRSGANATNRVQNTPAYHESRHYRLCIHDQSHQGPGRGRGHSHLGSGS